MIPPNDARSPAAHIHHRRHATGVALVLIAGVMLSVAGITLRHMEAASGGQILFYRSLSFSFVLALYLALRYRARTVRAFVAVGRPGLVVALSLGFGSACYVFALLLTTVANALFLISSAPFMAAVLGWIVLRERVGGGDVDHDDDRARGHLDHDLQRDPERDGCSATSSRSAPR